MKTTPPGLLSCPGITCKHDGTSPGITSANEYIYKINFTFFHSPGCLKALFLRCWQVLIPSMDILTDLGPANYDSFPQTFPLLHNYKPFNYPLFIWEIRVFSTRSVTSSGWLENQLWGSRDGFRFWKDTRIATTTTTTGLTTVAAAATIKDTNSLC